MSASARQVQRMLALVPFLQAQQGIPVDRVAQEFGVAPKVIRKDLMQLMFTGVGEYHGELIDVDLTALEEDGVVHLRDADFMTRPLRVTAREGAALIVALRTLRAAADAEQATIIDGALAKLEHAVGGSVSAPVDVHVEPLDPQVRDAVARSLAESRRLRVEYATASRDELTTRDVDPRRTFTQEGRLYLEAWCLRAEDLRFFRLDRIASAEVLDVPADDHGVDPVDLRDGFFAGGDIGPSAVLDLDPTARWIVEYYGAEVLDDSGDVWRIRLHGGDESWLRRLALRNAGAVRVVEPAALRSQVADHARSALRAYDGRESTPEEL